MRAELFHVDRGRNSWDEADSRFSNFTNSPTNLTRENFQICCFKLVFWKTKPFYVVKMEYNIRIPACVAFGWKEYEYKGKRENFSRIVTLIWDDM
jgi:hypothetical protein